MRIVRYYPRALAGDGGMTGAVCSSARTVARLGSRASVVYDSSTQREPSVAEEGLEWVPLRHRGPRGLRVPVGLDEVIAEADLVVLHSAWTSHNLVAAASARRVGTPYILEPRGAYDPHIVRRRRTTKAFWWRAAEERMVHRSLAVHVFFEPEREHLRRLGYDGPTVVSPNGVNVPDGPRWDGGSGGYLLWLGRFDPQHKGLDLLLGALALLPATERPALRLHGPDWRGGKQQITGFVNSRGLGDYVTVGAAVYGRAKQELLSTACAFVYPSRWEAFGNSVAEAASMGVPVLTTTYPLGTFLAERSAGIACDPSPESLAEGIRRILDPDARQLGSRARDVAEHDFNWERVVRSWLTQAEALL